MNAPSSGFMLEAPTELARSDAVASRRLKIAFLVRSLNYGGAERQLLVLAKALRKRGHSVVLVVFYPHGPLQADLRDADVRVRTLAKLGRWDVLRFSRQLYRVLREEQPDVLQGCHGVANLMAIAMRRAVAGVTVVCGIRSTSLEFDNYGWVTRAANRLADALRNAPDLFIANSRAALEEVVARGYSRAKVVVISNGIDTDRFAPDHDAGRDLREAWGIPDDALVIGRIGRLDPMKDHATFLAAAAEIARKRAKVRFVCVGDGGPETLADLQALGREQGLDGRLLWMPGQSNMKAVYNAIDILCSSSAFGEGFPNVVGEAMACEVPCVVTDVGDSARVVGDPSCVVPRRDPVALASRLLRLIDAGHADLARVGRDSRQRIVEHFSVERLVFSTEEAFNAAVGSTRR